jgi:hypothetical protein
MPSKKTVRMGTKAKPLAAYRDGFAVSEAAFLCRAHRIVIWRRTRPLLRLAESSAPPEMLVPKPASPPVWQAALLFEQAGLGVF